MIDYVVFFVFETVLDVVIGFVGVVFDLVCCLFGRVVGIDLSADMLVEGYCNVARVGLDGCIALLLGQGERLLFFDVSFDALTFIYLFWYVVDLVVMLVELAWVVCLGGLVVSFEFVVFFNVLWCWSWWLYTRLVFLLGGVLLGGWLWYIVGCFFGLNIDDYYCWFFVVVMVVVWEVVGFIDVGLCCMSLGGGLVMWGCWSMVFWFGGIGML